jgi:RNA polymerase sigma factor (sigma-70 family)
VNSDNHLMLQVKKGDTDRLGILFERYKNPLFTYFFRNTGHQVTSEDMVQTVFLRILKYRHTFDEKGTFSTWLYQVAHHLLIDLWSREKPKFDLDDLPPEEHTDDESAAENSLIRDEAVNLLSKAMEELDPDAREILVMSKYQGIKYSVIGNVLGCSEGAVKVRVFRALQELKIIYKKLEGL